MVRFLAKKVKSKMAHEKTEKKEKVKSSSKKETETKAEYLTKEDLKLDIPVVPEAPKKSKKITMDTNNLSADVLKRINYRKGILIFFLWLSHYWTLFSHGFPEWRAPHGYFPSLSL